MATRPILAALAAAALLASAPEPAAAQGTPPQFHGGAPPPPPPFTWAEVPGRGGPVRMPATSVSGWIVHPSGFAFRLVPSISTDPTVEVILDAPLSGHPTQAERFLLQFPVGQTQAQAERRTMVIGFHPFGVSEKSVFNGTTLPYICAAKGWLLLAPLGLVDVNFANADAQAAADEVVDFVTKYFLFDRQKVYTVGFSMGGLNAVSFALRHQDPDGLRVAGIIDHTGTGDLVAEWQTGTPDLKAILEHPLVFGATPAADPYAYERVNPFRLFSGVVEEESAQVSNLDGVPFFLHVNNADLQNLDLVNQVKGLHGFLLARGFDVFLNQVSQPGASAHSWATLPMLQAIEFLEGETAPDLLPEHGPSIRLHADRELPYRFTEVLAKPADEVSRFEVVFSTTGTNAFALVDTTDLDSLALDLAVMELDPARTLLFQHQTADGTPDQVVLRGYATPPASVLANGLPAPWTHDPAKAELTITPTAAGSFAVVQVVP